DPPANLRAQRDPAEITAKNRAVAEQFMRSNSRYQPDRIDAYMDGIDLSKPVSTKTLQKGDQFVVYERSGASAGTGSWATFEGTSPDQVGIVGEGRTPVLYTVQQPMTVLESTAKSYPKGVLDGIGGSGGG